ncbi:glutaredoxin family protein [Vitiosangium sp. GDMCC 1.1324]|uniref:glutaredoxin family protein n=1 Tax=Vitiosangium sp. (strain GDMCC 1.1324) TaxID=2138576 RepID=UPI000D35BCF8|nr:glutaredoxin family protein [Vitiosangium sp. GDMCC 1.1324]PTL75904.1 thioredoxin family protein [Vitiosangium sp. GDMCC 1.1324]
MIVRLYSKPNCCLCDQAKEVLERVRERLPFDLVEEDIRADPATFAAWRYDIPVVIIDGRDTFKLRLEESEVEASIRRAINGTPIAEPGGHGE